MNVLLTGGTGFIGSELTKALKKRNYNIHFLTNSPDKAPEYVTAFNTIPANLIFDVIINLAGHPIANSRWSPLVKEKIVTSRLSTTQAVVKHIKNQLSKPHVFISGSAIGFYGIEKSNDEVDETSGYDDSFSSNLCRDWEHEAKKAQSYATRTCLLRTGIVLGRNNGALKKMLLPFKLGLGGKIGDGKQWMPWIHIEDVVSSIVFCIENEIMTGAVNLTAPTPMTNQEFTEALGHTLKCPTIIPMPRIMVKLLMGKMGEELLLSGKQVMPRALMNGGFKFQYGELQPALYNILNK